MNQEQRQRNAQRWKDKIIFLMHDPWDKALGITHHEKKAIERIAALLQKVDPKLERWIRICANEPDTEASAADRPVFARGRPWVRWQDEPLVTHPLGGGTLQVGLPTQKPDSTGWFEAMVPFLRLTDGSEEELRQAFLWLWRRLPEELANSTKAGMKSVAPGTVGSWLRHDLVLGQIWNLLPADSRSPDHSIWDHVRLSSAWAGARNRYHRKKFARSDAQNPPHLMVVKVGSAGRFIAEARKSRDLWIGSYLLSDLALHAILPFVRQLGPDAILYPSLYGNPLFDQWLHDSEQYFGELTTIDWKQRPLTWSSMLPNRFVALVPAALVEVLGNEAKKGVHDRWLNLTRSVSELVEGRVRHVFQDQEHLQWKEIWDRQMNPPRVQWTAVPWERPNVDWSAGPDVKELAAWRLVDEGERKRQRAIWETWLKVPSTRTGRSYLNGRTAYTYPAVHHELLVRAGALKAGSWDGGAPEPGIKCQVDGWREVLRLDARPHASLGEQKAAAASLARAVEKKGRGATGEREVESVPAKEVTVELPELLSAPSLFRRYLVFAEGEIAQRREQGASRGTTLLLERFAAEPGRQTRAAFPSTHMVGAAAWLHEVVKAALAGGEGGRNKLTSALGAFNNACLPALEKLGEDRHLLESFRSLQRILKMVADYSSLKKELKLFLEVGPNWLQPEAWEQLPEARRSALDGRKAAEMSVSQLSNIARETRKTLAELAGRPLPRDFAVLVMDGDWMGELLLGLEPRIQATYGDILHPKAKEALKTKKDFRDAGWPALLGKKRIITPALHGFISRALAHFAYEVVPWLVEEKYHGRLIYAGGDDLLALVPVEDALSLAWELRCHLGASFLKGDWRWPHPKHVNDEPVEAFTFVFDEEAPSQRNVAPSSSRARATVKPEERIVPMLGASGLLSGAIVLAHVKTPLRALIHHAQRLLDADAKEALGRNSVVLSWFSRGGEKARFGMPWAPVGGKTAHALLLELRTAFFGSPDGAETPFKLSARLPYRLRARIPWLDGMATDSEEDRKLLEAFLPGLISGSLERSLAGQGDDDSRDKWVSEQQACILQAILQGQRFTHLRQAAGDEIVGSHALDGLFIARHLSGRISGGEG